MVAQQFCLRWNNHHINMLDVFDSLYNTETLVDVTLACEGVSIKAHKVVLSACSSFFQEIFINNPCKHPVVILKDMKLEELRAVLQFMYRGEVNVTQEQLPSLVKAAESLRVKGLAEMNSYHFDASHFSSRESSQEKFLKNSRGQGSSVRQPYCEAETASPSTSNSAEPTEKVTNDAQNEKQIASRTLDEPPKDRLCETKQSTSHPQLSALLDSSSVKRPLSPSISDPGDDDHFSVDTKCIKQEHSENSNFEANEDDRTEDQPNHYPMVVNMTDLSQLPSTDLMCSQEWNNEDSSCGSVVSSLQHLTKHRIRVRKSRQYSDQDMQGAIVAVVNNGISMYRACKMYGVPKETLRHRIYRMKKSVT